MTKAGIQFWWADKNRWFKAYTVLLVLTVLAEVVFCFFQPTSIPIAILFGMFVIFYLIADFYEWRYEHPLPLAMTTVQIHQLLNRGGYVQVERLDEDNVYITHHKEGADHE
ncbi:hypothetical protein [Corynebacterium dentalis]|uniref:hypothetical protein n=1 Tax=Corynebacterium dentalis TaxID=2014528 RepID=UPI00370DAE3F